MLRLAAALVVALGLWLTSLGVQARALEMRADWPSRDDQETIYRYLAPVLGRQTTADITWFQVLVYYADSQDQNGDFRYLQRFLNTIIELDPGFERVYRWAAYAVTFRHGKATQDEFETSIEYLEKAMKRFPDRYEYPWMAGLHYWLDLRPEDPALRRKYKERGADLIEEAMHKPDAPKNLPTLASALRTKLGQHERAIRDLREMILTTDDPGARKQMLARFREITKRPDLTDELAAQATRFEKAWQASLPFASPSMYVLLGPRPSPVIDFDELATDRDLFGSHAGPGTGAAAGADSAAAAGTPAGADSAAATGGR